jgi:hypothetical protein
VEAERQRAAMDAAIAEIDRLTGKELPPTD